VASVLLDTHILIWWLSDPRKLSREQSRLLNQLEQAGEPARISAITIWESAMLVHRGRIEVAASLDSWIGELESHPLLDILAITARIAAESVRLDDTFPKDPADRLIVATARCHGLTLITADENIRSWGKVPLV
jgi:PIN domain nuclease of toxin-antitoxin system